MQAWGFVLWKQCYVLVHEIGFPVELWTVVRDLWGLRLAKLMRKVEGEESGTEGWGLGIGSQEERENGRKGSKKKTAGGSPTLIDTICLCYMGMLLMRLPISLSQVLRWIHEEDVPYIRAIRHVPAEMKEKLPGEYHEALDTSTMLRPETLQLGVLKLCCFYSRVHGMEISPLNSAPLLYEYTKSLSLPLEVYAAAQTLNEVLKFDFRHTESGKKRRSALSYPEAQLISLVVIATKLLFPFDNGVLQHYSPNEAEQDTLKIDWTSWMEIREAKKSLDGPNTPLENSKLIQIKDTNVFNMSAQQLDQYMDWYQRTWSRPQIADDDVNRKLLEMFPLQRIPDRHFDRGKPSREEEIKLDRVKAVQASLKVSRKITKVDAAEPLGPVLRRGIRYQQFRDRRALSVSAIAKAFHEEAAEASCLSIDMLLRAILQTEQKLLIWRRAKRRAEKFGEDIHLEAQGAMLPGLEGLDQMTLTEATAADNVERRDSGEGGDDSDDNMKTIE